MAPIIQRISLDAVLAMSPFTPAMSAWVARRSFSMSVFTPAIRPAA